MSYGAYFDNALYYTVCPANSMFTVKDERNTSVVNENHIPTRNHGHDINQLLYN